MSVAGANQADGAAVPLEGSNIQTGVWNHDSATFTASNNPNQVNAVRVVARLDNLDAWLSGLAFDVDSLAASAQATAVRMPPPAVCAILAATDLDALGGIVTDSYDSTAGAYDPALAGAEGNLCGNVTVDLGGDSDVGGDLIVGRGGDLRLIGSAYGLTGTTRYMGSPFDLPTIDSSDAETVNDNSTVGLTSTGRDPWHLGGIKIRADEELELSGGVYVFDSLRLSGTSSLRVTGPTEIWVTGDTSIGGVGIVNATADPHNLTLYSTGSSLTLGGTSAFHGSVIAPEADVDLSGTHDFFGVVVGETVDILGDLAFHADTSLMDPLVQIQPWIALVE